MTDDTLAILQLKLDEYGIKNSYDENTGALTVEEHSYSVWHFVFFVIIPLGLFLITGSMHIIKTDFSIVYGLGSLVLAIGGLINAGNNISKSTTRKSLQDRKIRIMEKEPVEFDKSTLKSVTTRVTSAIVGIKKFYIGKIDLLSGSGQRYHFVSLQGSDIKRLEDDTEKVKELITLYLR